jgi:hypothetical protein
METLSNLQIKESKSLPEISFNIDGHLKMEGKLIPDNAVRVFEPLFKWIKKLKAEKIVFDVCLEYLNTSSQVQLFSLLQKIEDNPKIGSIEVNWYFDEDDEDHYNTGLWFEERLERTHFNYHESA